ncbi:MAG: MFS transporter, partial [Bacteroidales bacterium]
MAVQINYETTVQTQSNNPRYTIPLIALTSLFFMWGSITCMNDLLIPFFKKMFELTRTQSMLVQFAFFSAYFIGSLIYFIVSTLKGDPIVKIGYKNGLLAGLFLSALGCFLFYPASIVESYYLFLTALMVLAFGFTLLQIAANPYVSVLGPPEGAAGRLNLSGAFNSLGTALAPVIGGYVIFKVFATIGAPLLNEMGQPIFTDAGLPMTILGIQVPYIIFGIIFILLAIVLKLLPLPQIIDKSQAVKGAPALGYKHLVLGIIAIFMYVGGEVTIGSVLINFMHEMTGLPETISKSYLAFYWGGAMIGRFLGAISLSPTMNKNKKIPLMIFASLASFVGLWTIVYIESGQTFGFIEMWPYMLFMLVNFLLFLAGSTKSHKVLLYFSLAVIVMLGLTLSATGMWAIWPVLAIGMFNSIMWPNIFTLAIKDLGPYTSQGSSLLIMAILGGALVPVAQAWVADL